MFKKWFEKTPDKELAVNLRKKAAEFQSAMEDCKAAGLSIYVTARYSYSNNWDSINGKNIEVRWVKRISSEEV